MEPWVHYIPLEEDLSDLKDKINWARDNDEKVKEIVANGNALVAKWINPELMYCYYAKAFEKYAAKMSRPVQGEILYLKNVVNNRYNKSNARPRGIDSPD